MKKLILLCCITISMFNLYTQEVTNPQELCLDGNNETDTDITPLILSFITLSLNNDIPISDELEELHQKLIRSEPIDQLALRNALQEAITALKPLCNESEQANALYRNIQEQYDILSKQQTRAAFAGLQVLDKLTVHNQLVTYGSVSINSINNNPALSVSGQAIIDNLSVGTSNITNLSLGNVYGVTPSSPTQFVIINPNGTLGSTPGGGSGTGTVTSVSGGNGITITGNPTINPVVNLTAPVSVANGGTGQTSLTANSVLVGQGTSAIAQVTPPNSFGIPLVSNGLGAPTFGTVTVNGGGTGQTSFTAHSIILGEGTSSLSSTGPGTAGQLLIAGGPALDPSFVTPTSGNGLTITSNASTLQYALSAPVSIANGGTNAASMTNTNGVVYYDGSKLTTTSAGTANFVLTGNGPSAAPSFQPITGFVTSVNSGNNITITGTATAPIVNVAGTTTNAVQIGNPSGSLTSLPVGSNGQVLLGATGAAPAFGSLTSTGGTLTYTPGPNALNIDITAPVAIAYGGTNATSMSNTNGVIYYDGTKLSTTTAGTAGQILTSNGSGSAPTFQNPAASSITITGDTGGPLTGDNFTFTGGTTGLAFNGSGTTETLSGTLGVANGGTNATSFSSPFGVIYYNGTQLATTNVGPVSSVLTANGAAAPSFTAFTSSNVPNTLVYRDSSGNFSSNVITGNMINANPASGNAITVNGNHFIVDYLGNTTINGNVLLTNTSGTLQLPAGSAANPSLTFTGNTTSGLAATTSALSFITNNTEQMRITTAGTVAIDSFTTAGVVHNDALGNLSSSLIVNADISGSAAISDTKLATISTPGKVANSATTATNTNTPSTIVARDSSGNFSANIITASLVGNVTGTASGNLPLSGGTLTGHLTLPAGSSAAPSLQFTGSTNTGISAPTANALSFDVNGAEAMNINANGQIRIDNLSPAGVVHNSATGLLSTSLIVNSDITTGTIANDKLATISSSDIPGDIVVRDGSGNFVTNMITLDGTTTNATDAATKSYVDSVVGTGIVIHPPAEVVSTSPIATLQGSQTIDGITVGSGNRVLLVDQTNADTNGLWVATSTITSPWFRPTDFANGSPAGNAYVLITEGATEAGSSWLCSTPTAIIGSSPIFFQQFSLPNQVNGANVGSGTGLVFQNKSGTTLNFRSLAAGQYMNITTSPTAVTIATNATSLDTPSTLVARDASGNFAAGTITATNVDVTNNETVGGTLGVTGITTLHNTLNLDSQSEIDLHDLNTGNYVGFKAPATVNSNYTLLFPASPPTASQILQASSATPTQLEWVATPGNTSPSTSRTIYVTTYGNDTTGDGSFTYPYASLAKAVTVANAIATVTNPLIISIAPGTYIENNSAGPITLTTGGVTIAGQSASATFIEPGTLSNDLLTINPGSGGSEIRVNELTFQCAGGSTASAISLAGIGTNAILSLLQIFGFNTGISMGGTNGNYLLFNGAFEGNNTAIAINNVGAVCNNCVIVGSSATTIIPANIGISVTGSAADIIFSNGLVYNCSTGAQLSSNANVSFDQCTFRNNNNTVVQNSAATAQFLACSFTTNPTSGINIQASGAGTNIGILGCYFNGLNFSGSPQGTAILATNQANVNIAASEIIDYITGMQVGSPTDTSATSIFVSATTEVNNLTHDIIQNGLSKLVFNGTANSNKISINDSTNVELNYFNLEDNTLTIGKLNDTATPLITVAAFPSNNPQLVYNPSIYATQAMGYQDLQVSPTSFFVLSDSNTNFTAVTKDRTTIAGLKLVSDTSLTIGGSNGVGLRGWDINKNGTAAQLSFSYQNSDSGDGQTIIPEYTLMQLDGVNNQVQLPNTSLTSPTEIVFGGDTYLYRNAVNSLKTNGNFVVGGSLTVDTLPAHTVLIGEVTAPITGVGPGTAGQLLISAGASADPTFVTPTAGAGLTVSSSASTLQYALSSPVSIIHGGTNTSSFSSPDGVIYYNGTKLATTNVGSVGQVLTSNGTGSAPTFQPISATGAITQINGNSGSVSGSTITIKGGNNITTSGAGSTLTVNVSGTTPNALQVGSPNGALHSLPAGTNGQVLLGATGAAPAFISPTAGSGLSLISNASMLQYALSIPVSASNGGTGATSLLPFNILAGNGTSAISTIAPTSTSGIPLVSNGLSTNPSFSTASVVGGGTGATSFTANSIVLSGATGTSSLTSQALTNGQLLIGSTGVAPVANSLTAGTGITITPGAGSITIASSVSSGITMLAGDIGSATGSTVTLNANTNAGATVKFSGSGSTMNLLVTSPTTFNTFIGLGAGSTSATGANNTALGYQTLDALTTGSANTGVGYQALTNNTTGTNNTALGYQALNGLTTGGSNIAIGYQAGSNVTTGTNNIHIGISIPAANESNTIRIGTQGTQTGCYIAGVYGIPHSGGSVPVQVTSDGHITGQTSSRRYKENIVPLACVSNKLTQLKPVTFTYKVDNGNYPQYGLIAEDVHDIYPEWIVYDKEGEIYSVNYAFLPPILLKGWQEQQAIIEKQQQKIDALCKRCLALEERLEQVV